jgi:hypothetical protein
LFARIKIEKKRSRRNAVSDAAAIERICFTSPGCGRRVVELIACGAFIKKLQGLVLIQADQCRNFPAMF